MYIFCNFGIFGVWSSTPKWLICKHQFRQCLVPSKFQKFYKISRHIKSLDACMEH
jgi:hypothetical protein